jgi:two-component system chemotaxis response regulator CheY
MKILIVDDFAMMRKIIKNLLKDLGYKDLYEAENGKEAFQLIQKHTFDLVVTDWNMPELDGYELLKMIRMNDNVSSLPVIMVTAEAKKSQIVAAAKAGVNGYIVKPFTGKQIKDKMSKIFDRIGR